MFLNTTVYFKNESESHYHLFGSSHFRVQSVSQVLQASVMFISVIFVAVLGTINVGGIAEVWNRAVEGNRIFPPELVSLIYFPFFCF